MNVTSKILLAASLSIGLSHAALAEEGPWNWIFISPASPEGSKPAWFTDQGSADGESTDQNLDIRIGGAASSAEPDHLVAYDLKGTIRGKSITAELIGLDSDESPQPYSGKLVTHGALQEITLMGPKGSVILLYRTEKQSK